MAEDLILHLHSFTGNTLGGIFSVLNQFIKSHNNDIQTNIDYILQNYKPNSELEKVIRIRLIDHFKCSDEVLNIFKGEDVFYISQALQCSWFFENLISDAAFLVCSVLPYMSFSTRMKVLKKYSKLLKDKNGAEHLFNQLKERYGSNIAMTLLPACSEQFIKQVLETTSIQPSLSVIISVYNLYPEAVISFITRILDGQHKNIRVIKSFRFYVYDHLFTLIASKYPLTFATWVEKYNDCLPYLSLGKRATRRFVKVSYESVKNNVLTYKRFFTWKKVISHLTHDQTANLQLSAMPKTPSEFISVYNDYSDFVDITASLKDLHKKNILLANFNKAYGKPITEYFNDITYSIAIRLPEDICEKWIEKNLPEVDNQYTRGDYITHLPVEKSIPFIKKMIDSQSSDVNVRAHYVSCLFKTVILKDNYNLIGSLCEYIVKRLRNDRYVVKENVIRELSNYKNLRSIPEESWASIEELYNIMLLNNEAGSCLYDIINILSVQIHSRFEKNLPVDAHLGKILKIIGEQYAYDLCAKTPYERQCLVWFLENFPPKKNKVEKEKYHSFTQLFESVCEWNAKHSDNRIEIPFWMKEKIEKLFSSDGDEDSYHKTLVLSAARKDKTLKYKFYDQVFPKCLDHLILIYKLNYEPKIIANKSCDILKYVLSQTIKDYNLFFKQARLYSVFNIPQLFSDYCINVLNQKPDEFTSITPKKNAVYVLSIMLPTNKFVGIISNYYPQEAMVTDYSDESKELFEIQSQIAACLKSVNCPSEVLDCVRKFAKGDYLKLVISSLSSICLRTPEHKILPLLNEWLDCPISLRKHFIRAYFKISPLKNTLEMIVRLFENEKNPSLRLLLFEQAFNLFSIEPSSETFSILKAVVEKFNSSDDHCIDKLYFVDKIYDEFIPEYFQILWDVIKLKGDALLSRNRNNIISLVNPEIIILLSEDFCGILLSHIFEEGTETHMNFTIFAVHYLLYSCNNNQLDERLEKVTFELGKLFSKWNNFDLKAENVFKNRNIVSFIISSIVRESFSAKNIPLSPTDIITKLKSSLLTSMREDEFSFEDLLLFEISTFFHTTPESSERLKQFSNFIEPILDKGISVYDTLIIDYFCSAITNIFLWMSKSSEPTQEFELAEVLLEKPSKHCNLLGLKLLPTKITKDIKKYNLIVSRLLQSSDPTIKVHVNKFFCDLSSDVKVE